MTPGLLNLSSDRSYIDRNVSRYTHSVCSLVQKSFETSSNVLRVSLVLIAARLVVSSVDSYEDYTAKTMMREATTNGTTWARSRFCCNPKLEQGQRDEVRDEDVCRRSSAMAKRCRMTAYGDVADTSHVACTRE